MSQLVAKTTEFVTSILNDQLPSTCIYHNLTHTKRVLKSTKEIISNSSLSTSDQEVLLLAALLHDIGYIHGCKGHEEESAKMATTFLQEQQLDETAINKVVACILATKMKAEPSNELEKIIRDADSSHFAKDYFEEASEFLRLELKFQNLADFSKNEWLSENINLLQTKHSYYTTYALANWEAKKEANLAAMIQRQQASASKKKIAETQKNKLKLENPERAIQSVFRVTLKNHIKLSDIADTKANILLSVNAIIISIALSNLFPKLDNPSNSYLIIPTAIFLFFTVISMVLSVLATRPNVTSGRFTKEDVDNKKVNLLFFGNFHKMSLPEFEWAMNEMINDKGYIYSSMTKDLYFLGLVLQRKYKILRITYTIFIIGIVLSVIAYGISFQYI